MMNQSITESAPLVDSCNSCFNGIFKILTDQINEQTTFRFNSSLQEDFIETLSMPISSLTGPLGAELREKR